MAITTPPLSSRRKTVVIGSTTIQGITEASMTPTLFEGGERKPLGLSRGSRDAQRTYQQGRLTMGWDLNNDDGLAAIMALAGYVEAGTTPTSSATAMSQGTIDLFEDGRKKQLTLAMASRLVISGEAGGKVTGEAEFMGVWNAPTDASGLVNQINAPGYRTFGMTIGGSMPFMSRWELDFGLETAWRPDLTSATGLAGALVSGRTPVIRLRPESRLVAAYNAFGLMLAGTTMADLAITISDGTNTRTFTAARAQRIETTTEDDGNYLRDPVVLGCHNDDGDDDVIITYPA